MTDTGQKRRSQVRAIIERHLKIQLDLTHMVSLDVRKNAIPTAIRCSTSSSSTRPTR